MFYYFEGHVLCFVNVFPEYFNRRIPGTVVGLLLFRQCLPLKCSQFAIKSFGLCDLQMGYLWSSLIYTTKDTRIESSLIMTNMNKTSSIVVKFIEPLRWKDQTVWMDIYNISPKLARSFKATYLTDCIRTLKLNRKNVLKKTWKIQNCKRGDDCTAFRPCFSNEVEQRKEM